MDITNKMLADLAGQLGIDNNGGYVSSQGKAPQMDMDSVQKIAERYKGKSESEILAEIERVREAIKKDRKTYEQQLKAVKALRPMMNAEQRAKLDYIIRLLEE